MVIRYSQEEYNKQQNEKVQEKVGSYNLYQVSGIKYHDESFILIFNNALKKEIVSS
jgi:hypothetical protein